MAYDVCTPKQELFAQEVAKAENLTEAHRIAYPNNMTDKQRWETASKLMKIPKVFQRVQELKAETAKATGLTREWIVEQTKDVLTATRAEKEYGASVQALKLLTTLGGFDKQTVEHQGSVTVMSRVIIDGESLDFGLSNDGKD